MSEENCLCGHPQYRHIQFKGNCLQCAEGWKHKRRFAYGCRSFLTPTQDQELNRPHAVGSKKQRFSRQVGYHFSKENAKRI